MVSEAAAASMVEELLPLVDDLERALKAEAGDEAARRLPPGVELIHRQLGEILRKRGVRPIEALGADFDPHYHQAVVARAGGRTARRRSHRRVPTGLHARRPAAAAGDGEGGERVSKARLLRDPRASSGTRPISRSRARIASWR